MQLLRYIYHCQGDGSQGKELSRIYNAIYRWVKGGLGSLAGPSNKPGAEVWDSMQQRLLLYFSRFILIMGMYRIVTVQIWYIQGRERDHPSIDLPLLSSFFLLLMVWSHPCFRSRIAMDLYFWLLQILSITAMLLAQQKDVMEVVVLPPASTQHPFGLRLVSVGGHLSA